MPEEIVVEDGSSGRALLVGFITGLRSMMGLAVLAGRLVATDSQAPEALPSRGLRWPGVRMLLRLSAAGELIGDKLPVAPARTAAGPLGGRVVLGALAGASVNQAQRRPALWGALLGAVGALVGSWAGYTFRTRAAKALKVPDLPLALIEDAVTIYLATRIVPSLGSGESTSHD